MFGFVAIGLQEALLGGIVLGLLLEVLLFWVASALVDAPELKWGKLVAVAIGVAVLWLGAGAAIGVLGGVNGKSFAPENRENTIYLGLAALFVSWLVPAVLYPMLVPLSVGKGLWMSFLQVALRAFLYTLIVAFVMVFLGGIQIYSGGQVR